MLKSGEIVRGKMSSRFIWLGRFVWGLSGNNWRKIVQGEFWCWEGKLMSRSSCKITSLHMYRLWSVPPWLTQRQLLTGYAVSSASGAKMSKQNYTKLEWCFVIICRLLEQYESLRDPHLAHYFSVPKRLRHLRKVGFVRLTTTCLLFMW